MQKNKFIDQQLPYLVLVIIAILLVVPLLWVLLASLDANPLQSIKIPQQWTLDNYVEVLTSAKNQLAFANGLFISLAQALIVVALAALAAYPLSRYELKHKRMFMFTILFMTSLPVTALMVPVYHLFLNLHLYDNRIGVILFQSASSLPYAIWMMKNFMDSVPMDLEEAAWVDGATIWQGIRRIVTPLMLPGLCMVGVYTFSGSWGNFFVPYILLGSASKFTASITLYQFFGAYGQIAYGQLAAYSVLYTAPSVILYTVTQKFMSKGFSMQGATKG